LEDQANEVGAAAMLWYPLMIEANGTGYCELISAIEPIITYDQKRTTQI
jgi:hypothetical protein